ncbi:MAG: magnesium transporter [Muribaculum sp.]|nr:magnesium transporter [Muribaculaceae bacterium]MCM1081010.1 magnesium transporter [Muribaculum sp.]
MKEYTNEYIDHISELIESGNTEAMHKEIEDLHPADIAALISHLDRHEIESVYGLLDTETAADVLVELDEDLRDKLLSSMSTEDIAKQVIDHLDIDDAVDIIQDLDEEDQHEVLSHLHDTTHAGNIIDLLKYDEDTAGGIMSTEMIVVNENWSMPQCVTEMRKQAEDLEEVFYVYVVDNDNKLCGVFPLRKMITHPSVSKIKHVMDPEPMSIRADTPVEDVTLQFEKYDLVAMPVVDSIGRLVGQITVDDVMDEARESSERDYQLASGLSGDVATNASLFAQTRVRLPWLLIGMLGGIANSMILSRFEGGFAINPTMALFIPLIGGTGGNVGIQSSAIIVQGLANGSLDAASTWQQILKELGVGLINASIISLLVFIYNMITLGINQVTTIAVSLSLFAVVVFASVFGTFVPLTLEKLKIDPALATGPFISITNDIIGMVIYMVICSALIVHLA